MFDRDAWRRETEAVDALAEALLARDGAAAARTVRDLPDCMHARVWARASLPVLWHDLAGRD
ncbi:hypothetical protein [Methylobacterium iners]|uniref:Uncharacterized protein n=1 Tax=Methylobacterium iners TaxID=418707 RepID=A0ABQ4S331_9HYPH|nr:hypothetical protein [Methylobacterium iners]GJD97494.1 hypothetical protein OCOJLMKI_4725 [Methylobacterium iners]